MTEVIKLTPHFDGADFPGVWYDFANEEHFWCKARLRAFNSLIKAASIDANKPMHGFEVGCGNGLVRRQIESITQWTLDGTDLCLAALGQNNTKRGTTYFYNIHDRTPKLEAAYDFIVLFDVLEHIDDPVGFLESVLFHLKPGGWFFLNVPALESLRSRYDEAAGHIRRYVHDMFAKEANAAGLDVVLSRYWGLSMVPMLLARQLMLKLRAEISTDEIIRSGFRPPSALVNSTLDLWMSAEQAFVSNPPIGTSLMAAARKR